jgi:hypothetical protein
MLAVILAVSGLANLRTRSPKVQSSISCTSAVMHLDRIFRTMQSCQGWAG